MQKKHQAKMRRNNQNDRIKSFFYLSHLPPDPLFLNPSCSKYFFHLGPKFLLLSSRSMSSISGYIAAIPQSFLRRIKISDPDYFTMKTSLCGSQAILGILISHMTFKINMSGPGNLLEFLLINFKTTAHLHNLNYFHPLKL